MLKLSNIAFALSLVIIPLSAVSSSAASDFPVRDVDGDCYNVVSGNHNSDAARSSINYCIDIVQRAYDSAIYLWDIVAEEDQNIALILQEPRRLITVTDIISG